MTSTTCGASSYLTRDSACSSMSVMIFDRWGIVRAILVMTSWTKIRFFFEGKRCFCFSLYRWLREKVEKRSKHFYCFRWILVRRKRSENTKQTNWDNRRATVDVGSVLRWSIRCKKENVLGSIFSIDSEDEPIDKCCSLSSDHPKCIENFVTGKLNFVFWTKQTEIVAKEKPFLVFEPKTSTP